MSVALELRNAARDAGLSTSFVATGQTGMMIEGWGVALDRVISDFVQGTVRVDERRRVRSAGTGSSSRARAHSTTPPIAL